MNDEALGKKLVPNCLQFEKQIAKNKLQIVNQVTTMEK